MDKNIPSGLIPQKPAFDFSALGKEDLLKHIESSALEIRKSMDAKMAELIYETESLICSMICAGVPASAISVSLPYVEDKGFSKFLTQDIHIDRRICQ